MISQLLTQWGSRLQDPLLLLMRLYWGWQFFVAGKGKFGQIEALSGFFTGLGIPFPTVSVLLVATVETLGGLLLFLGLGARLAAVPLAFAMVVALLTAHREAVATIFSDPGKFLAQEPIFFLLTCLLVLAFGPGQLSLDNILKRFRKV